MGIVKLVLERKDINPNTADTKYSQMQPWWAAIHGPEGVVQLLLEQVDNYPNTADTEHGRTLLGWGAKGGYMC